MKPRRGDCSRPVCYSMKYVTIQNLTNPQEPLVAGYCASFWCRLRGLMFRRSLPSQQGLLLVQARDSRVDSSIHMLFMWMDLGVVWINGVGKVVDLILAKKWRPAYFPQRPARYILEIPVKYLGLFHIGDKIRFEEAWLD